MHGFGGQPQLPIGDDTAKMALAAMLSAVKTNCDCKACQILRTMSDRLEGDLTK